VTTTDNHRILGLDSRATHEQIREARRALSLVHHPDRGGDPEMMALINRAADELLADSSHRNSTTMNTSTTTFSKQVSDSEAGPGSERVVVVDRPSFTIDVLPVVAHEVLTLAVASIGEIMDDDPPYVLEFVVIDASRNDHRIWCRADIVPDAGASTVSLSAESRFTNDLEWLRDLLVREINALGFER
jgi:hypothetical protein